MSQKKNNQKKVVEDKKSYDDAPPVVISVRTKTDITFFQTPFEGPEFNGERIPDLVINNVTSDIVFTPSGHRCAVTTTDGIIIANTIREPLKSFHLETIMTIPYTTARWVSFSPKGNYLLSFETYRSASPHNLIIWDISTGESVMKLTHIDELSSLAHLPVQWTHDETHLFVLRQNGGALDIYNIDDYTKPINCIQQKKLSQFQLSPFNSHAKDSQHYIALFSPSYAEQPARLVNYRVNDVILGKSILSIHHPTPAEIACGQYKPNSGPIVKTGPLKHTSILTTFRATECVMSWHYNGQALLVQTLYDDDDLSSNSYYGENRLFIVHVDREPLAVTFSTPGTIQDAQWCPTGFEFATLHGESKDTQATIWFAKDCTPVKELGSGAWNTIRYSPNGKLILVAGFGSLAGRMEIWEKNRLIRMYRGQDSDSPRDLQWTPCGRYFYAATMFPWLRVENQFKINRYDGKLIYRELPKPEITKVDVTDDEGNVIETQEKSSEGHFCQVTAVPYDFGVFPSFNVPTQLLDQAQKAMKDEEKNGGKATGNGNGTTGKSGSGGGLFSGGKYVPPHLRNASTSASTTTTNNSGNNKPAGARDLLKERKKGNSIDTSIGVAQVRTERPPPTRQAKQQQPQQSWRRSD